MAWALTLAVSLSSASPCSGLNRPRPGRGTSAIGWHSPAGTARSPSSTTFSTCRSTQSSTSWADRDSPDPAAAAGLLFHRTSVVVHHASSRTCWRCPCSLKYLATRASFTATSAGPSRSDSSCAAGSWSSSSWRLPWPCGSSALATPTNGTTALRLLVLVGPAYVIKDHYVAIRRAQGRLGHAAKVMAAGTSAEAAGAALGGISWGVTGLCVGWAIAASVRGRRLATRGDWGLSPGSFGRTRSQMGSG